MCPCFYIYFKYYVFKVKLLAKTCGGSIRVSKFHMESLKTCFLTSNKLWRLYCNFDKTKLFVNIWLKFRRCFKWRKKCNKLSQWESFKEKPLRFTFVSESSRRVYFWCTYSSIVSWSIWKGIPLKLSRIV